METREYDADRKWISKCNYFLIQNLQAWEEWKKQECSIVSLDIETAGLNPDKHVVAGISLCVKEGEACYIPLNHSSGNFEDVDYFIKDLPQYLSKKTVLAYNAKFDIWFLKTAFGMDIQNYEDVMISSHMDFPDALSKGLKPTTLRLIGKKQIELKELFDPKSIYYSVKLLPGEEKPKRRKKVSHEDFCNLYPEGYPCDYACSDVDMTFRIYKLTEKERIEQKDIYNIEKQLLYLVLKIENNRVILDADYFSRVLRVVFQKMVILEKKIFDQVGRKYNILSPAQTADILVEMGVPLPKNDKDNYITDKSQLQIFTKDYPLISDILTYRKYSKAISGYLLKLYMGGLDERGVKFRFNQVAAATGRFSSSGKDKAEGAENVSAKDQDSDFIAVNAQNITANSEADWFKAKKIKQRRLKDTGQICYTEETSRLTEEEIAVFETLKERLKETKSKKEVEE